jgi:hypothetical protein
VPDLVTRRLAAAATALATAAALAALPSAAALARAPADPRLWATINVCDPPARPGAVGVRISIPREKGAPRQWARIRLQFFDGRAWRRVRAGGDTGFARYGIGTRLVQGGTTFTFPPPAEGSRLELRGLVDVEWRRGTKVVDRAQLRTTAGHADPNDRSLRQSSATCVIKR